MSSAIRSALLELAAIRKAKAQLDGRETVLLAELAALPDAPGKEWIREDVAIAMRLPSLTAHDRLHDAAEMSRRFPHAVAAMCRGEFGRYYVNRLVDATVDMSDAAASRVEERVLPNAGRQTYGQFSAAVRRAAVAVDTRSAEQRAENARGQRRIQFTPGADATGELWALLPVEAMHAIRDRVQALADTFTGLDDRSAEQRRVDAFIQLCLGTAETGGGLRPTVNIHISLDTLLGMSDEPADLDGDTLPAKLARVIAHDPTGTWRRIVTDPVGGQVLDIGRRSYEPTAVIHDHVIHRDPTCRFATCGRKARNCDLDHVQDWDYGGPTADWNLIPLCPRHHHLKHDGNWRIRRDPDGTVHWHSPHGTRVERPPDPPPV